MASFYSHGDAYEALVRLTTIPAFSIPSHSLSESSVNTGNGHFFEMLRLFRCVPINGCGGVAAEGTDSRLGDYLAPVFQMYFELELALF